MAGRFRAAVSLVCVSCWLLGAIGCEGKRRPFGDESILGGAGGAGGSETSAQGPDVLIPGMSEGTGGAPPLATDETTSDIGETMGPRLEVAPSAVDLGDVVVDLAAVRIVSVSNTGGQALPIPTVALVGGSASEFTVLQNGCQDPLEPGESCSASVQFLPVAPGDFSGTVLIDAEGVGSARIPLTGTGLPPGDLLLSAVEGSSAQFGAVLLGQSSEARFTLLNPGVASSGALDISVNNPEFAVLPPAEGDCAPGVTELANGQTCTVRVAFTPTRREPSEAILTVRSAAIGSTGLRLDGVGSAPAILAASSEEIAVRAVLGQSARVTVRVENRGDEAITLTATSIESDSADVEYTLVESDCAGALPGGAACELVIEFKPNDLGPRPATLLVTPETGDPLGIPIAGEGLKPGALVVSVLDAAVPAEGQSVDFGAVRRNQERILAFRVSNPGDESSGLLEQITASGDFAIVAAAAGECSPTTSLVSDESCDVRVRFRPAQRGLRDGALTIVSVAAGSVALPLRGTGTVPADIAAEPANVQLGSAVIGETRTATVTVTNEGDEAATAPQTQISGAGAEAFAVTGCGAQLAPLATCSLTVTFRPTQDPAHTGLLTPTLQITSASGGSANVSLTARGLRPGSLDITPATGASTAFQTPVNGSQTQNFNITNTGGVDSGALSVSVANPTGRRNFELVSSGQATACQAGQGLSAGSSCSVGVAFRPVQAGTNFSATLSATSSGAGTDSISLTGVAQALAALSSPTAAASFPNGVNSPEFVWRIDNTGDVATAPLTLGTLPAGFSQGTTGDCPFNQAGGLPARSSCRVPVRFTPTQPPVQGRDQVLQGTITVSAGQLAVSLGVTGTIPRALAGRGQVCVSDSDCQPGQFSFCGSSGSNDLPNVCCNSPCRDSSCSGCTAGANGGTCSPRPLQSECVTSGTGLEGLCTGSNACTEFCIFNQSLFDQCLLTD
jgi:hypothetical protein